MLTDQVKKILLIKKAELKIILLLAIIGSLYGCVSAFFNQNPYYSSEGELLVSKSEMHIAWHWEPSPAWFPSYLLCKVPPNGFGIHHTKSGYLFRSQAGVILYFTGSTILGLLLGIVLAVGKTVVQSYYTGSRNE